MPSFSKRSLNRLHECDHHLVVLFEAVIKYRDCTILEGYRGKDRQNQLYREGKSKVIYPNSNHNKTPLSLAVDVAPYFGDRPRNKRISFIAHEVIEFSHYCLGIRDAMNLKDRIRWGGDWNRNYQNSDEAFLDAFHWEVLI